MQKAGLLTTRLICQLLTASGNLVWVILGKLNLHYLPFHLLPFMSTLNSRGHDRMVSYLTTLPLRKPPGGSLPVLSAHSFASNWQFALLQSARVKNSPRKNVPNMRNNLGGSLHATDWVPCQVFHWSNFLNGRKICSNCRFGRLKIQDF